MSTKRNPPCPAAIKLAATWAGQTFSDEAEALLALELSHQAAIEHGHAVALKSVLARVDSTTGQPQWVEGERGD
jgi:hypothetical protein